jgi:cytochrome c553
MKRFAALVLTLGLFASPALATNEFAKEWKTLYLTDSAAAEFSSAAKKAGCNVCHVKGGKKTERNEYGKAINELLKKEDYTKEKLKADPELAKKIIEGLKTAGESKSSDGKTFAAKLEAGVLPATDSGL